MVLYYLLDRTQRALTPEVRPRDPFKADLQQWEGPKRCGTGRDVHGPLELLLKH